MRVGLYKFVCGPVAAFLLVVAGPGQAREFHVGKGGDDANRGTSAARLKTISAAALLAQPGDTITVHEGVYRERINPPRGGTSPRKRIVYRAADGETVVIKGSEVIKGWERVTNDTWKVTIPDEFFGDFNPFKDRIRGDWFGDMGRAHHTGAVYLEGHWLTEATNLVAVLNTADKDPLWIGDARQSEIFTPGLDPYLLNLAWLSVTAGQGVTSRVSAVDYRAMRGVETGDCSEGGRCIGWIRNGFWAQYQNVDFGKRSDQVEFRAASPDGQGKIEIRLDRVDGPLLGLCEIPSTGGWQSWRTFTTSIKPTSGKRTVCLVFKAQKQPEPKLPRGFTVVWAQFKGVDPNQANIEVNARQSVFYPSKPGMNYITVRGFTLEQAATPWAPPTAEQIGVIGTHWSRGWIIENNTIRYSTCSGVTLGKYGDEWDNRSGSADAYVKTIKRALENGWAKENIGGHMVRNNHISHCEQAGIVGSLGAVFSTIKGNEIHDIHVRRLFDGAEMAGIKIHAAIDVLIEGNHIYRTCRGIWLDWMAQGTRVSGNLLHHNDNRNEEDLFVEVNHGPFLVDNNIFLSNRSLGDWSEGGAYVNNLFTGGFGCLLPQPRETPFHRAHSTELAGIRHIQGGDDRFFNNIFMLRSGLSLYDGAIQPVFMDGNVFTKGTTFSRHEKNPTVQPDFDPAITLVQRPDGWYLEFKINPAWGRDKPWSVIDSKKLGLALTPKLPFEKPDGTPYRLDKDYFGHKRNAVNCFPGPFASPNQENLSLKVWPRSGL